MKGEESMDDDNDHDHYKRGTSESVVIGVHVKV